MFKELFELATMQTDVRDGKEITYPAVYDTKGQLVKAIDVDRTKGLLYHRKIGKVRNQETEKESACGVTYRRVYPMRIVAFFPKNILGTDDKYIEEKVFENINSAIAVSNPKTLRNQLKLELVNVQTRSQDDDRNRVLKEEIKGMTLNLQSSMGVVAVDYDIILEGDERCFTQWSCGDEGIIFECPTLCELIASSTAQQGVDCIEAAGKTTEYQDLLCENSGDATITVNGEDFTTAPCGETTDIPVVNTNNPAQEVGSKIGNNWVIGFSNVTDSDGSANLVPAEDNFACIPQMDADFSADNTTPEAYNDTVQFTDSTNLNPTNWFWDFGDGNTSTLQNPTHIYEEEGDYTVRLGAWKADPFNAFEEKTDYITVGAPIDTTNLVGWWRGGDTVESANGVPAEGQQNVLNWLDSSAAGNDALQTIGSEQPRYYPESINGKGVVGFDGTNERMNVSDASGDFDFGLGGFSVYVVCQSTDVAAGILIKDTWGGGGNGIFIFITGAGQYTYFSSGVGNLSVGAADSDYHTLSFIRSSTGANGVEGFYDGVSGGTITDARNLNNASALVIGGSTTTNPLMGNIAEILVYDTNHNAAQRQAIEDYLQTKYAHY